MREHRKHPVIFSGLQCSIPLPKLNHFVFKITKSNGFWPKKTQNCKKKMAPKAPTLYFNIHNFTGNFPISLKHTVLFQSNINQNNIFVIQSWGIAKKIRIPPLNIAIFLIFSYFQHIFAKIRQNPYRKRALFYKTFSI